MDFTQISDISVTVLTHLSPYLAKAGGAAAEEAGKELFSLAKSLYGTLREKLAQSGDKKSVGALDSLPHTAETIRQQLAASIARQAQTDAEFAEELSAQVESIRILLFNCLKERFLVRDLKEVYFRLGVGWDDLVGEMAGRNEKAIVLIQHMVTRKRIPDLIRAMWEVNSDLRC